MIVLAFHGNDHATAKQVAQEARDVARHARVVCRNGDAFTGWIERTLGRDDVVAVHAPHHPHIVAAYAAAGIPHLEMPTEAPALSDDAPVVIEEDAAADARPSRKPRR